MTARKVGSDAGKTCDSAMSVIICGPSSTDSTMAKWPLMPVILTSRWLNSGRLVNGERMRMVW